MGDDTTETTSGIRSATGVRAASSVEEVAAVVAAAVVLSQPGGAPPAQSETPRWRFSGRWWTKPVPARRARP